MEIRQITNKQEWEDFAKKQSETIMTQSSNYGDFFESMGEESWVFGVYEDEKLIGGSLVVSTHAKRGSFLYLPYGPIGNITKILKPLTKYLKQFAKYNNYDFIRVSPFLLETNKELFENLGYKNAPMHVLAETTWLLDLKKSEDQLLADMNKNHRNLIRRCIKEGVLIEKSEDPKALEDFNKLHDFTAKRHKFTRFSNDYVDKEFEAFKPGEALVYKAYLPDGKLDTSSVIFYYGNMACYRHSASLLQNNKIPTSYLLQWESIKEAKNRGMEYYNFWGIAPENSSKKHPFFGITHFKKGFGGFQKDLLHCQDLPITKKYWINWTVETLRRIKRGF
jgi:peptidoglycan pentaglycine glycine transferase (the first glycine)